MSSTTLDVKVNMRELSALDRKLKETFGGGRTREFARGMGASDKSARDLLGVMQKLTAEMAKQRENSAHTFGALRTDARDARREVAALRAELEKVKGGGGGSGGGFGGGNAGRKSWSAPQIGMPDASSLATAMSSVPVVGVAAGGATMASYQMYGSALGYQTARRDTFSALGPQGAAMLGLKRTRDAKAGGTYVHGDAQSAAHDGYAGLSQASGVPQWMIEAGYGFYSNFDKYAVDTGLSSNILEGVTSHAVARGHKIEKRQAQSAQYNAAMGTRDLEAVGQAYGVNPADALREAAGLSSALGGRASAGTYDFARSAQTYLGVDMGTTGGLMKSFGLGGGLVGQDAQADAVAELIGSAVARGLEGSEIGEYLGSMASVMQRQADLGQQEQMLTGHMVTAERLQRTGFTGQFATSYAAQLGQAGSQMGYGGGGADPIKFMMAQQLGFGRDGAYGADSYAQAMLRMQDPDSAAVAGLGTLAGMSSTMRDSGMGANVSALMLSRMSGLMGAQLGPDAARRMAEGVAGPGYADGTTSADDIRGIHRQAGGSVAGLLIGEAGMESRRIQAGYDAAPQVQALNGMLISLAQTAQNVAGPALDLVTSKLRSMASAAEGASGGGSGVGGGG